MWHDEGMNKSSATPSYKRHRFSFEVIRHCVWLYFRFCLSYRDVEEMMAERGVMLTYESIRRWCLKFGQTYANRLRRRRCGKSCAVSNRQHKRLNNRVENSHQPTRQWERAMRRFKSAAHAQRFLSAFEPIRKHFCPGRHRLTAQAYRQDRLRRLHEWDEITRPPAAA